MILSEKMALTRRSVLQKTFLILLFFIMAIPAVLRGGIGNDYMRYVAFFHLVNARAYVPTERGFNTLVRFLYALCGYENYILVFAVFAVLTILFFLRAVCDQAEHRWFSLFLFVAFGYYFQIYNTVRYYFALSLVMMALSMLLKRRYAGFVLLVLLAALFHKSALIVLLLYPLCMLSWSVKGIIVCGIVIAAASFFRDFWMRVVVFLYPSYEGTEFLSGGSGSLVQLIRCAAVLVLAGIVAFFAARKDTVIALEEVSSSEEVIFRNRQLKVYTQMQLLALMIYLFGAFIPEVSRIGYYLTFTQIFLIPMLLYRLPAVKNLKKAAIVLAVCAGLLYFGFFVREASEPDVRIFPYRSFLFTEIPEAIVE